MYERTTIKVIFEKINKLHFGIPMAELKIEKKKSGEGEGRAREGKRGKRGKGGGRV